MIDKIIMNLGKVKNISLSVAIAIVLALFVNVGIATFYDAPDYEDCYFPRAVPPEGEYKPPTQEELDELKKCENNNRELRSIYNRDVFIVLIVAGLLSLLAGLFLGVSSVASGFLFGGILNLFIGVVRFWTDMDEYLRFIILGITLVILIWVGYKKLK
mgnify:CR=1 FL=1